MGRDSANVCNICGGPLDCYGLRQCSTAEKGDDELLLYSDDCDCYRPDESDYDPDDDSFEALDRHDPTCTIHYGLHGGAIPEHAIRWLDRVQMLRRRDSFYYPETNSAVSDAQDGPTEEGDVYLTKVGRYDDIKRVLTLDGESESLQANEDGFLAHAACWNLLDLVFQTTGTGKANEHLPLRRLYLAMQGSLELEDNDAIEWRDRRLYGDYVGVSEPWPLYLRWNHEPLVADPNMKPDFSQLFVAATTPPRDPFSNLPAEICTMIMELLPSTDAKSLINASQRFASITNGFPNTFLESRIYHETPWVEGTGFWKELSLFKKGGQRCIDYKKLARDIASRSRLQCPCLEKPPRKGRRRFDRCHDHDHWPWEGAGDWLGLKNRCRIWKCCEAILEQIGGKLGSDGSRYAAELRKRADFRLASINPLPGDTSREWYERPESRRDLSEIYFCSEFAGTLRIFTESDGSIHGIQWTQEGKSQLVGWRTEKTEELVIPKGTTICGFILSLGQSMARDKQPQSVKGLHFWTTLGLYGLGKLDENDLVHIFRPGNGWPNTIVGIAAHAQKSRFLTFGIITNPPAGQENVPGISSLDNADIHTRWFWGHHLPTYSSPAIDVIPAVNEIRDGKPYPFRPPILRIPAVYVDIVFRQLSSVIAIFLQDTREIIDLIFLFVDGVYHRMGHITQKAVSRREVHFDVARHENIHYIRCLFENATENKISRKLIGIQFITTKARTLALVMDGRYVSEAVGGPMKPGHWTVGLHVAFNGQKVTGLGLATILVLANLPIAS
ncbi:hypothetical protein BJY00DRAFT_204907 [Aspergillus carlsbadensis]|nr:hypothetical protein BJY00DRAFT_204907 [Aspergillus carlsbadensis]